MKTSFNYKSKRINLDVKSCNVVERAIGLMFKKREKARALLFDFKKPVSISIHSFFVFFPFIAVWLDNKNKVVDIKRIKPFILAVKPKKSFTKIVEIPINKTYEGDINLLDDI